MRSTLIVASVGLLIGTVALLGLHDRRTPSARVAQEAPAVTNDDVVQLQRQSQQLAAEVKRLRALVESAPAAPLSAATAVPQPTDAHPLPATPPGPPVTAETAAAAEGRYRAQLDQLLTREPNDPSWSEALSLPSRVRQALPEGSSLEDLRCGNSLCRVLISHPSMDVYNSFSGDAFQIPDGDRLWSGPGTFMVLDDAEARRAGRVLTVMYLGRGTTLPALAL